MGDHLLPVGVLVAVLLVLGGLLGPSGAAPSAAPVDGGTALEAAAPRCVDEPSVAPEHRLRADPAAGRPEWIRIPRLGVAVPVVAVAMQDGVLVPPSDPWQLGWWNGGAVPGARRGTAVVTGHTVSNGDGALDDLHLLTEGDRFYVRTVNGRIPYTVSAGHPLLQGRARPGLRPGLQPAGPGAAGAHHVHRLRRPRVPRQHPRLRPTRALRRATVVG